MKSKSTNLARGVFAWFCFMLVVFSLIFTAIYGLSVFSTYGGEILDRLSQSATTYGQVMRGELR